MHPGSLPRLALLLFLVSAPWSSLGAANWPRWRGPSNNGHAPKGTPALATLPAEPAVLWQVPAGEGLSSPVVAGGKVLAFDNQGGKETLRLLDAKTGKESWRAAVDEPFSDSQGPTGPRNTPLIDGDRVYAVSCRGELQCRKTSDGSLVWHASFVTNFSAVFIGEKGSAPGASRHGNDGSPLIDGNHLLACVGGTNGAGIVCFDKKNGKVVWQSTSDQAGYAPPVLATIHGVKQVVCYTVAGVVGVRRDDGRELWRVPVKTSFARHVTTPIVHEDWVVVSSHQAGLLGIRVGHPGAAWTAAVAWTNKPSAINYASPVAVGGHLYGVGATKDIICVEIATGAVKWSQNGVITTSADKAYAGMVVVGSNILALTDSGELVLFPADPKGFQALGRVQVGGVNWCNPAFADGVVYLRDGFKQTGQWKAVRIAHD